MGEQARVMLGLWNAVSPEENDIPEGRDPLKYMRGKISAGAKLFVEEASGRDFWFGTGLPTAGDIAGGSMEGQWGKSTYRVDAATIAIMRSLLPISADNTLGAIIDSERDVRFDTEAWSGMTGIHFTEDYGTKKSPKSPWARRFGGR
jgi:hypothetical protein